MGGGEGGSHAPLRWGGKAWGGAEPPARPVDMSSSHRVSEDSGCTLGGGAAMRKDGWVVLE